jgi:iron complex outermembrane recepter protein
METTAMITRALVSLGAATLLFTACFSAVQAADSSVEQVVVTGSRIRRIGTEGPTSIVTLGAKDLDSQGYKNVFDALNQQTQNTGFTQGADFGNTFTPAANAISLRDLGPNHALVLVNGRRVTDYPTAYDGSVNFVNLANVPSAAIERIEILNAGASAIYGSDAIAGVVNVVLKERIDDFGVNVKLGTTQRGGGDNWRLQASGGADFDRLNTVFAVEFSGTDRIDSFDRDFMSSTTLQGAAPTAVWSRMNLNTNRYIAPGNACAALDGAFQDSVALTTSSRGAFCGSGKAQPAYWTTQTENYSRNLYGGASYALNDAVTLFGNAIVGLNTTRNNTRGPSWTAAAANGGYFFNQNTGDYEAWTRRIAPEEMGGTTRFDRKWEDTAVVLTTGIKGNFGDSGWSYEAAYSGSQYVSRNTRPRLLKTIDSYFLGPQLGTDADGIFIYAPDPTAFSQALTPAQFDSLVGKTRSKDRSWLQTIALSASGELLELPAGALQTAAVLEWGNQGFENIPDAQINQDVFYNTAAAAKVGGTRSRYAAALEFNVPVLEQVNATLAMRYDDYSFAGRGDNKINYNAGLEYRPVRSVLLRGNYATSFRAPDMNYIYQTLIRGYYSSTTDYYRCQLAGQSLSDCEFADVSPGSNFIQSGSKQLRFENGKSFGYGLVFSPTANFDVSVDYWDIKIDDLVTNLDADTLLRIEADCRAGERDAGSSQCVDALRRIRRNAPDATLNPNAIVDILIDPINAALERTSGIDVSGKLQWNMGAWGDMSSSLNYTKVLSHEYRQFASDAERDLLHSLENSDWPDKAIVSLTWSIQDWTSTLQVTRYGRIPNAAQEAYLTPTSLMNVSTQYKLSKQASVALIVHNALNTIKRDDSGGWPFYPVGNYSPFGREGWLQFDYNFGG